MANGLFNLKQVMQAVQQGGWPAQKTPAVEYLVVAGGGGGGEGAGGAGGLLTGIDPVPNGQTLLVTIGGGGSYPANGSNSVFGNITSIGGGRGGVETTGVPDGTGFPGGSGGGGAYGASLNSIGGQGTSGQGNAGGGNTPGAPYPSGGGGGAGTVGLKALGSVAGNGGAGIASAINGTVTTYAGGGGGGLYASGTVGTGGAGGGGNGGNAGAGSNGAPNKGGGGGGGAGASTGGSGIVVVSYPDTYAAATTVNATASTSGSGSLYLNNPAGASNQSLYYTSANTTALGAGDFCIETFVWWSSSSGAAPYVATNFSGSTNFLWGIYQQSSLSFYVYGGVNLNSATLFTNNAWNHLVVCRTGTVTSMFLNGTKVATATDTVTYTYSNLYVGQNGAGTNFMNGYLSNFRIVVGNSIYTATASTITVPTAPFVATSQTKFLLSTVSPNAFLDSSASNLTPTLVSNSGVASWNQLSPFTGTGYKNRVYTWTTSGTITF
jgi:hypothetical protein